MHFGDVLQRASALLNFLTIPGSLRAAFRAPKVSVPSISLVGTLRAMGVRPTSVIDVGANEGQFTSACLAYSPATSVLAIEALPDLKVRLDRVFAGHSNVTVVGKGCGCRQEKRVFHANEYAKSSSFLSLATRHREAFPGATRTDDIEVEVLPLDLIMEQHAVAVPELLKLDVQGFELEVLKGASKCLRGTRHILMETSFVRLYEEEPLFLDYLAFLSQFGFVFRGPVGFLTDPRTGVFLQMDALFERAP